MRSYKTHFSRSLVADRLHFAAHSHHLWPDVTRDAHLRAWDDAARFADTKWDTVFGEVVPAARAHAARWIDGDAEAVAFAPNVHDLLVRLFSCVDARPARLLATDGEFHSFSRQARRWVEAGRATLDLVPTEPFDTLAERFAEALTRGYDLAYTSHVFFDSGYRFDEALDVLVGAPEHTLVALDAYHGFGAVPTSLGAARDRVFYLGGGYKYAMAGEGACFVHAPPDLCPRPVDTGWFAAFGALSTVGDEVPYAADGTRFMGATLDPTALYRFVAVQDWLVGLGLDVADLHARSLALQERFVAGLDGQLGLDPDQLVVSDPARRGNFLTFRRPDAVAVQEHLLANGIVTDARRDRLRFGFGLYHDPEDVDRLLEGLRALT